MSQIIINTIYLFFITLKVLVNSQEKKSKSGLLSFTCQSVGLVRSAVMRKKLNNLSRIESVLTLAADVSHMVENSIKFSSQVRVASVKGRVARDGLDHCYLIHSVGEGEVRKPDMQSDRANWVHGVFKRR